MCRAKELYKRHNAWVLALAALVLTALVLFAGGGVGLSDNGDYTRVMVTNSLERAQENPGFVYQSRYRMAFQGEGAWEKLYHLLFDLGNTQRYPSLHLVFVRASLAGNLALNLLTGENLSAYHVQVLGAIYAVCWAGLLFLLFRSFLLPRLWADLPVKLLAVFLLCDEGYIAYFNSLYSEPVQMLGLLAVGVFALRCFCDRGRWGPNLLGLFAGCVTYGWGKFANLPVGALFALGLGGALLAVWDRRRWKWVISGALASTVILAGVYLSLPAWMDYETNYNAVFYGVLKDAGQEQQQDFLAELGLPGEMAEYADSNYYTQRAAPARASQEFQEAFSQVDKLDLLLFYLRHPGYFLEKLDVAMAHTGWVRPFYLSNLDASHPRLSFAGRFGGWSWLREQLSVNTWAFTAVAAGAGCLCLWRLLARRGKAGGKVAGALAALTLLGALGYQLAIPLVTNGEGDLAKHMFAFVQLIDLLLLFLAACFGAILCQLPGRLARPAEGLSPARRRRERVRRLWAPAVAAALLLALGLSWGTPLAVRALEAQSPHAAPEQGAYVQLGEYRGQSLVWQVVEDPGDGTFLLLAAEAVAELPFDTQGSYGSNLWEESSLRQWLKGDFLAEAFSPAQQALLVEEEHRVLLSSPNQDLADSGWNDFFAFHIPAYSDRGAEEAFARQVTDLVRLPDITLLAGLARENRLEGPACWMETPYYNNGSMVRTLTGEGYFLMADAGDSHGVRPVVRVREALPQGGDGSRGDPFVLG